MRVRIVYIYIVGNQHSATYVHDAHRPDISIFADEAIVSHTYLTTGFICLKFAQNFRPAANVYCVTVLSIVYLTLPVERRVLLGDNDAIFFSLLSFRIRRLENCISVRAILSRFLSTWPSFFPDERYWSTQLLINFAGLPATTVYGATSFDTTLPAPTTAPSPTTTPFRIIELNPIHALSQITTGFTRTSLQSFLPK